jgi:hypothetical protein
MALESKSGSQENTRPWADCSQMKMTPMKRKELMTRTTMRMKMERALIKMMRMRRVTITSDKQ